MRERVWVMLTLAGALCAGQPAARAQAPKHLHFEASIAPAVPAGQVNADAQETKYRRGTRLRLTIKGNPDPKWYTYPAVDFIPDQKAGVRSEIILGDGFLPVPPIRESPEPKKVENDPLFGTYNKFDGPFTWQQDILIRPDLPEAKVIDLPIKIDIQECMSGPGGVCNLQVYNLNVSVPLADRPPAKLSPDDEKLIRDYDTKAREKAAQEVARRSREYSTNDIVVIDKEGEAIVTGGNTGLWGLLLTAVLSGLISLATPCVFPMIPITVSIFIKQGETEKGSTLVKAIVYCLTLVVVLTAGGVALASALQSISQHWATNVLLTGVFAFFGFSLLGAYDITLPSWLSDTTASGEGKGGLLGVAFMALTFSIISFACVGPIYGGFTALSASDSSGGWTARLLAPLVFSLAFASPFFVLALFPRLLKAMPRSGSWMNTVKVVMGFLEIAAALKFIRAAELNWLQNQAEYFTFDVVMGLYVALSVAAALYLFGMYRLPHDHDAPESISVTRLGFALVLLGLGVYLLPGVFKTENGQPQKPRGVVYEWAKAFLLPDEASDWPVSLPEAMARAEKEDKPLFIDFTGPQCTNCKLNESRIFSQPRVKKVFEKFVTLQLNSDKGAPLPGQVPDNVASREFRDVKFKNFGLPYYVVVRVKGKTLTKVGSFEDGVINDADDFAKRLDAMSQVK